MFSLVISLISLALVAALALGTVYYGGESFSQGLAEAEASKILNQVQQLQAADTLFRVQFGRAPAGLEELVSKEFLKAIPSAQAHAISRAIAASQAWTLPVVGQPVFLLPGVVPNVCRAFNLKAYGSNGILTRAHEDLTLQCFGEGPSLAVVSAKALSNLAAVAIANSPGLPSTSVTAAPVPTTLADTAWSYTPTVMQEPPVGAEAGDDEPADSPDLPVLSFVPDSPVLYFYTGTTTRTITVSNTGAGSATLGPVATTSSYASRSGIPISPAVSSTCSANLAAGASCKYMLTLSSGSLSNSGTVSISVPVSELTGSTTWSAPAQQLPLAAVSGSAPAYHGGTYSLNVRDLLQTAPEPGLTPANAVLAIPSLASSWPGMSFDPNSGVLTGAYAGPNGTKPLALVVSSPLQPAASASVIIPIEIAITGG